MAGVHARRAALGAEAADLAPVEQLAAAISAAHAEVAAGPKPKPPALPAQETAGVHQTITATLSSIFAQRGGSVSPCAPVADAILQARRTCTACSPALLTMTGGMCVSGPKQRGKKERRPPIDHSARATRTESAKGPLPAPTFASKVCTRRPTTA